VNAQDAPLKNQGPSETFKSFVYGINTFPLLFTLCMPLLVAGNERSIDQMGGLDLLLMLVIFLALLSWPISLIVSIYLIVKYRKREFKNKQVLIALPLIPVVGFLVMNALGAHL
jgi:hypothetical protein